VLWNVLERRRSRNVCFPYRFVDRAIRESGEDLREVRDAAETLLLSGILELDRVFDFREVFITTQYTVKGQR
jgi:hypothetical protein